MWTTLHSPSLWWALTWFVNVVLLPGIWRRNLLLLLIWWWWLWRIWDDYYDDNIAHPYQTAGTVKLLILPLPWKMRSISSKFLDNIYPWRHFSFCWNCSWGNLGHHSKVSLEFLGPPGSLESSGSSRLLAAGVFLLRDPGTEFRLSSIIWNLCFIHFDCG